MREMTGAQSVPNYASRFLGRDSDLETLERLVFDPDTQFITITGTAGVGKTRLAYDLARSLAAEFDDGAVFVPLAQVSDPGLAPGEIAKALGLSTEHSTETIRQKLADWNGLLVLDNFEQIIDAAGPLSQLIPYNPNLTIIATSQGPLHISGERVIRLSPLPVPVENASEEAIRNNLSVQLLLERACAIDATVQDIIREPASLNAVASICRRLDGIPLALELAASRLAMLSPEVVLAQLDHGHSILSSERSDVPERQRTMQSAIAWSFDLLPEYTRKIFTWLSVFPAGFDLDLVDRVTASAGSSTSAIDTISQLINLSMITRVSGGSNPWYTMLVSIREHCISELNETGDRDPAESVVAEYVIELADKSKDMLSGPNIGEWLEYLSRNLATIRSAVTWAIAHENPMVPMSVGARMTYFFDAEGLWREVVSWIDVAMQWRDSAPPEVVLNAQISKLQMQETAHDLESSDATDAMIQELLEHNEVPFLELRYLTISGNIAIDRQQWEKAIDRFERTILVAEQKGIPLAQSAALANLGNIAHYRGDYTQAESYLLQALTIFEDLGNQINAALSLSNLGSVCSAQGKYQEALTYLQRASAITDSVEMQPTGIYILLGLSEAHHGMMDLDQGDARAQEAILQAQTLGFNQLAVIGHTRLASSALTRRDISSMFEQIRIALDLQVQAKGMQEYVVLGILVAHALHLEGRVQEATTILGKSLALASEIEHTHEYSARKSLDTLIKEVQSQNPNYDQDLLAGEAWSLERFVHSMNWVSRRNRLQRRSILVEIPAREENATGFTGLTPREIEILLLIIEGKSTREMAEHLSISPRTVTTHVSNIMEKMGVSRRSELVAKALRNL